MNANLFVVDSAYMLAHGCTPPHQRLRAVGEPTLTELKMLTQHTCAFLGPVALFRVLYPVLVPRGKPLVQRRPRGLTG